MPLYIPPPVLKITTLKINTSMKAYRASNIFGFVSSCHSSAVGDQFRFTTSLLILTFLAVLRIIIRYYFMITIIILTPKKRFFDTLFMCTVCNRIKLFAITKYYSSLVTIFFENKSKNT